MSSILGLELYIFFLPLSLSLSLFFFLVYFMFTLVVPPIDALSNIINYLNKKLLSCDKNVIDNAGSAPKMLNLKVLVILTLQIMCK